MSIDYSTHPTRKPFAWRRLLITFAVIAVTFILFCSGLPIPIIGGASHELTSKLKDDFSLALPNDAVVEHGARMAYRDTSYYFVVRMPPSSLQPFITSIRTATGRVEEKTRFDVVGPQPPNWFDPGTISDLKIFDVEITPGMSTHSWRIGYSPSTGKLYMAWMSY